MKNLDNIFVVFGSNIESTFENVKSINTKVIPGIGDFISLKEGLYKVESRLIDYKQVQGYDKNSTERGGEMIYLFVKPYKY